MEGCADKEIDRDGDLPCRLREEHAIAPPRRWGLVVLLVLACLLPRVWEAGQWGILWSDSVFYFQCCQALERGDPDAAFQDLNLNIYPVILFGLRRTGLDWAAAGQWWSVLVAVAAVLPLFGWTRRQFNDRVAVLACLLYAFHPKLVAYSPLVIRDPTFWFLVNLSIYLLWRAVTEIRWWLFAAAGAALTLAIHTRFEGWLLVVPLVLWAAGRLPAVPQRRTKLVLGALGSLAVIPLSVALVNFTVLRAAPQWDLIRPSHQAVVAKWLHSILGPDRTRDRPVASNATVAVEPPSRTPEPVATAASDYSGTSLARKVGTRVMKMYCYAFGLMALLGVWGWRRVYLRFEHQVLLLMALLLLTIVWIRLSHGPIDIRYLAPMVLVSFPWMALGLLWLANWAVRLTSRYLTWEPRRQVALVASLTVLVVLLGLPEKHLVAASGMRSRAAMGQWIFQQLGARQRIYSNDREVMLLEYYSQGLPLRYFEMPANPSAVLPAFLKAESPDVIVVWLRPKDCAGWEDFVRCWLESQPGEYQVVAQDGLPADCRHARVLVRSGKLTCGTRSPSADSRVGTRRSAESPDRLR
jgi:hypothetical protein